MAATHLEALSRTVERGIALLRACIVLFAASAVAVAAAAPRSSSPRVTTQHGPINVDAASTDVNYATHQVTLRQVVVSQGDLRVSADRADATGLNFDDSRWTFTGNVHITSAQQGDLRSDSATVEFRDNRMQSALATGHPAEFEQTSSKSGQLARGHADTIEYTVSTQTVRFTRDAWLEYGDNQITGCELVYNILEQKLQAASAACGRVHITVLPKKGAKTGAAPGRPGGSP